jgi:glycosyltransferase involved in cell wall biosynthesis
LIDPKDSIEFAAAIKKFLNDKNFGEEVGKNNLVNVMNNFSWEKNANETCEIYQILMGNNIIML